MAVTEIEKIAGEVQILQFEVTQTLGSFLRICDHLMRIRQRYGQKAYESCLKELGLEAQQIETIMDHISGIKSMPENIYQKTLYSLASKTAQALGLTNGGKK